MTSAMKADTRRVSLHELRHALCAAIAVAHQHPDRYADFTLSWEISGTHGSMMAECGDIIADPSNLAPSKDVARLAALGPASTLEITQVITWLRDKNWVDLITAAKLSDADSALISELDVPLTTPALMLMGVKELEDRLKLGGMMRLAKLLWTASNQKMATGWKLTSVVPQKEAVAALKRAQERLDDILDPPVPQDQWDRMTVKERLGRRVAKGAST